MAGRDIAGWVGRLLVRSATRDATRYSRAFRRNVRRTLGRPVRTTLTATFVFALFFVIYLMMYEGPAVSAALADDTVTVTEGLALLPPLPLLALAYVVVFVLTVVASISQGIRNDLGLQYR